MADAAKSDEIEDVLSSIRRLVSEHQAPARANAPETVVTGEQAQPDAEPDNKAEALILTPALRVTDPEDPWVPITPRGDDEGAPQEAGSGDDWAHELLVSDASAADDDPGERDPQLQEDQWEASESEEHEETPCNGPALDMPLDVTEASDETEKPGQAQEDEDIEDVPLSFIRSTSSVSDYEPEEGDGLDASDLPQAMRNLARSRAAQKVEAEEAEEPSPRGRYRVEIVKAALADGASEAPSPEYADTPSGQEGASGATQPQAEDAPTGAEEASERQPDSPAAPEEPADTVTDLLDDPAGEQPSVSDIEDLGESPFSFPDDDDSFVDEEALRDLIAEVVREELQGEMGVRITRNIRKLVRREIRLALAAQDLE